MSTTDEIKSRIDIVDLVSESGVKLRKSGRNYTGFCPFHANKHTPAFVVWPETGTWRCFGECNEGGDIFKFVMKKDGLDFREALTRLAARAGVELPVYSKQTPEQKEAYDHLRKLLEDAVIFYRSHLQSNAELLAYLRDKRGLTNASIETFGLGCAPNSWDAALTHFTQRGYPEQDLIDAGLLTVRDEADGLRDTQHAVRTYDRFRHRIMIPIRDENGRMAGFGARIVDPNDTPKFLNSPDTAIFTKGRLLYGLDRARKPIRAADQAVIVEGYLDVIALHQAGYENVVSPMGTALTEDQLRLLKRFSRKIVLALDPDTAGQKAVLRGLEAARQAMAANAPSFDQGGIQLFDAPGLMRFAGRLDANISVVAMPDGLDPDEIIMRDKNEWPILISNAKPIVIHVMDILIAERDVNDPKVKSDIVAEITPLIESISDSVERDDYRQRLARRLKVDERVLIPPRFATQAQRQRVRRRRQPAEAQVESHVLAVVNPALKLEAYCLSMLFRKPELLYRLDRKLQEFGLGPLSAEDFGYTDHQLLFRVMRQAVEQDEREHHQYLAAHLPETLEALSKDLLKQTENFDPVDEKNLEELLRGVIKLRRVGMNENLNQLRFLQEEAQQSGDLRAASYAELVLQHTRRLRDLDQAHHKISLRRLD